MTSIVEYNLSDNKQKSNRLMTELSGIHSGKRAFIVCNGPSLKAEDLTKIYQNGDISFACNKIQGIFDSTPWRPTYYCVIDEGYQHSLVDVMNQVPAEIKFFRESSYISTKKVHSPTVWIKSYGSRSYLEHPMFSEDLRKGMYTIATVTYAMFQIAVHMGIKELYIIGCDNSYAVERTKDGKIINKGGQSYFKGSGMENSKNIVGSTWECDIAYEFAARYAHEHGIKIFNATRGGHLEAFQRVDFDSLF